MAAALVLSGCAITHGRLVSTSFLDFRPYTEAGFFLSPDPYPGEFEALGEIIVTVVPSLLPKSGAGPQKFADGAYSSVGQYVSENIPGEELLDLVVKAALDRGADGIADFKCAAVYEYVTKDYKVLDHYDISGLAIKRK